MVGYPSTSHQFIYNEPKVQFANTLPMSNVNSYFASTMNPYVDVDLIVVGILHRLVLVQMVLIMQIIILNLICKSHCQIICML
jgi:hypothetical protein